MTSPIRIACCAIASAICAQAQSRPYSSSVAYQAMLKELHRDPARPSRMGAGTLPRTAKSVPDRVPVLETSGWRLEIGTQLALTNKATGVTWRMELGGAEAPGGLKPAPLVDVISEGVIRVSLRSPVMKIAGAGPFFGLGERFDRVKLDGLKTTLSPQDLLGRPNGHNWTYIPVPFLFTPRGLGIYLDTASVSTFDVSDSGFSIRLENPSVDIYFFVGEPKKIIENYTALTGRSPMLPPWAFGIWICSYQGPDKVLSEAKRLRQERIPASAIWTFDVMGQGDIMGWPLWWTGYYPHPALFTAKLHRMGFKALTYVHPYLRSMLDPYNLPNPAYEAGVRSGLFVLDAQGRPEGPTFEPFPDGNIDFTRPANVDWWESKIREILLKDDFDGWMEDFGEWIHEEDRFAAGVTGRKMENLNPLFYHKITYEITHEAKPDAVEFDRSGYAGSQAYTPVVWGGDQFPAWEQDYGFPSVVRAGITAGLSGFAVWGPDIAGNGHDKELWTRWVEFGALTPVMRNHLWDKPEGAVTLWHDRETIGTFRRYARLHMSLFPYFYTYAQQATKTGLPVMRHPMLEFPGDQKTYDTRAEYFLGDKILVAPVVEQGATRRSLYLPQGSWVNYWTGEILQGGREATIPAPLEDIPILVRAGSILPFIDPRTQTLARGEPAGLTWRVFPASAPVRDRFTLYDKTAAEASRGASRLEVRVEGSPEVRHYKVIVPAARSPRAVMLNGKRMDTGWAIDAGGHTLQAQFEARDFVLDIDR